MASSDDNYVLVVAIDFGTTFSGYAMSVKDSPEEIRMNKNWGESLGFQSYKTPTAVLTDKSGDFVAYGFDAEQEYSEACEDEDEKSKHMLFRHFKMMLYNKENVKRKALIASTDGTIFPALEIFTHALKYLKQHMMKTLKDETGSDLDVSLIRWVITVPAIWGDEAKQFMREAAYKAGFISSKYSKQLIIALEPEVASLCCRRLKVAQYSDAGVTDFPVGTKYLVVDCGGGTVDITAHITDKNNSIKELTTPSGGPWGGTEVDKNFIVLLESVLGSNFVQTFRSEYPREWLTFMTNFERVKKAFKSDPKCKLTIPLTWAMFTLYSRLNGGRKLEETLKGSKERGVGFASGSILIANQAAMGLFLPIIQNIVKHLTGLVKHSDLSGLQYIFMVGGFSECKILQNFIKEEFGGNGLQILIPSSAQLAVLKGAVLYGHRSTEIAVRRSKYTYGQIINRPFDKDIHDVKYRYILQGKERCNNIFDVYIVKGEEVKIGATTKKTMGAGFQNINPTSKFGSIFVRMDDNPNKPVQYTDDPRVTECGFVSLESMYTRPPLGERTPPYTLSIEFGGTELVVEIEDEVNK